MTNKKQFRVITPDGLVSYDFFTVVDPQPDEIRDGCLLVTHLKSGRALTVHATRLLPAELPMAPGDVGKPVHACLKCGHVEGLVADSVLCPEDSSHCGLVASKA